MLKAYFEQVNDARTTHVVRKKLLNSLLLIAESVGSEITHSEILPEIETFSSIDNHDSIHPEIAYIVLNELKKIFSFLLNANVLSNIEIFKILKGFFSFPDVNVRDKALNVIYYMYIKNLNKDDIITLAELLLPLSKSKQYESRESSIYLATIFISCTFVNERDSEHYAALISLLANFLVVGTSDQHSCVRYVCAECLYYYSYYFCPKTPSIDISYFKHPSNRIRFVLNDTLTKQMKAFVSENESKTTDMKAMYFELLCINIIRLSNDKNHRIQIKIYHSFPEILQKVVFFDPKFEGKITKAIMEIYFSMCFNSSWEIRQLFALSLPSILHFLPSTTHVDVGNSIKTLLNDSEADIKSSTLSILSSLFLIIKSVYKDIFNTLFNIMEAETNITVLKELLLVITYKPLINQLTDEELNDFIIPLWNFIREYKLSDADFPLEDIIPHVPTILLKLGADKLTENKLWIDFLKHLFSKSKEKPHETSKPGAIQEIETVIYPQWRIRTKIIEVCCSLSEFYNVSLISEFCLEVFEQTLVDDINTVRMSSAHLLTSFAKTDNNLTLNAIQALKKSIYKPSVEEANENVCNVNENCVGAFLACVLALSEVADFWGRIKGETRDILKLDIIKSSNAAQNFLQTLPKSLCSEILVEST